jgi:hypothetical protein
MDKIPTAVVILIGTFVVSVIAGFNDELGKFLMTYMIIVALIWLAFAGPQKVITKAETIVGMHSSAGGVQVL